MSEPEWSLPFNRPELIARCEVLRVAHTTLREKYRIQTESRATAEMRNRKLEAALRRTKAALSHYPGAWKSLNELIDGLLTEGESDADTNAPNR